MPVGHNAALAAVRRDSSDSGATRLGALAQIARAAWAGSRPELLRQVANATLEALDVASLSISQWEPELGRVRVLVNHGALAPHEVPEPPDEVYSVETYTYLRELVDELRGWSANVDTDNRDDPDVQLLVELGKHCSIGVAIPLDGRVWGELYLTRFADQPCFHDGDIDMALVVAAQIGAALATADHLDRIEQLAHTDPLTGLANRRAVDESLESAFARRLADGSPVSLIVCDLNGLKRINDDQGHEAGDRALIRFASLLSTVAGSLNGSLAARLGGDEFCIVAATEAADTVVMAAEELCRLVLRSPLEGVSCGVASTADDVGDVDTAGRLFRLADAAQYRAKRSGATVPVVAGRSLPGDVASHMSQHGPITSTDRRVYRGRELSDSARVLRQGLELLDDARAEGTQARLASVGELLAHRSDALGWWVSSA
ncbi:MAG TPA: sensor domain-containing diguanylate cyclase, partial [Actinomycetes bacterium]|nr:sensor domain-containing diguanylate cyclase [Actinomycetes bacterium]